MNRRAKFDTSRFILGGEIRNRTKHTHTQNYKKNQIKSKSKSNLLMQKGQLTTNNAKLRTI